jgi:Tfp pilus assembly protein PilZ
MKIMLDESGKQFDKWIVAAFIRYHAKTYPQISEEADVSAVAIDRRRNARVRKCVPVSFLLNGKSSVASSVDISMGGIFIATDEDVQQGSPVELSITVANDNLTVEAVGRISWVNSWPALKKATLPAGFGVELLEYKEANEGYWQTFLSRYVLDENFQGGTC